MKFPWQKKPDAESGELEFPDELAKKIEAGAAAGAKLDEVNTKLSKLDSVEAYINELKTEREENKRKQQQQQHQQTSTDKATRIEELMLEGKTQEAIALATQDTNVALMTVRADGLKREVFEDEKAFPYYHGDVKKEVDALLAGQSLAAKNDKSVIENCYKTVVGNHVTDIVEGKLKNRWAGESAGGRGTSSGSAGKGATGGESEPAFDSLAQKEDIAKAAKLLGYKSDEYRKMLDNEGIGYA